MVVFPLCRKVKTKAEVTETWVWRDVDWRGRGGNYLGEEAESLNQASAPSGDTDASPTGKWQLRTSVGPLRIREVGPSAHACLPSLYLILSSCIALQCSLSRFRPQMDSGYGMHPLVSLCAPN
jgi:hypothetical protein